MTMSRRGTNAVILHGSPGYGDVVEGEALVSQQGFSARYDLNRDTGVFSRRGHDLFGQSIADKIAIFSTAKGGVATAWALMDMKSRGVAPKALIFRLTNPVMVQGAVLAEIPILHRVWPDPVTTIASGDWLRVVPARGRVTVLHHRGSPRARIES